MDISHRLYRAEQVRALDRLAIEVHGIPGQALMERAGRAAFAALRVRWPEARAITVCCGAGNNGGDGYVMARLATEAGLSVQLIALKDPEALTGDAARAARRWIEAGGQVESLGAALRGEVIVDALFGTGLDRPAAGDWARMIEQIADCGRPVLAVDVPSGLSADTGMPLGPCVRAQLTMSFIGNKRGLWTGEAGHWCGERLLDLLDTPAEIHQALSFDAELLTADWLQNRIPPRRQDAHKGVLGHVVVVGGDMGMAGAAILAAQAALRAGSGRVSLATRAEHAGLALSVQPELMAHGVETLPELEVLLERADVLALGPGLGQSAWSKALWRRALAADRPLVVDADALNLLAGGEAHGRNWVLTPHPGEAARLLGRTVASVQADRFAAARALAERFDAVVVLKGHGSLIAAPAGELAVCAAGNPAMATAGMGDALSGIIASLIGQGQALFTAARLGVLLHALAGDRAARGRRQILASDLIAALAEVLPE